MASHRKSRQVGGNFRLDIACACQSGLVFLCLCLGPIFLKKSAKFPLVMIHEPYRNPSPKAGSGYSFSSAAQPDGGFSSPAPSVCDFARRTALFCGRRAFFWGLIMARPHKPETEKHHNRLSVYLTDDDDLLIRQLAARKGIAPGVLARALLVSKLDQLTTTLVTHANASVSR